MACDITLGRLEPCKTVGGLKAIYIMNDSEYNYSDLSFDADELVTGTDSNDVSLYKFDLRGANTMDEVGETNEENGTSFWATNGSIQLKAQDKVTRKQLKLLTYSKPAIISEGWDGTFKLHGAVNGCTVSMNTNSGSGMGDFNGYTLTITSKEVQPAFFVDPTIIDDGINFTVVEGV